MGTDGERGARERKMAGGEKAGIKRWGRTGNEGRGKGRWQGGEKAGIKDGDGRGTRGEGKEDGRDGKVGIRCDKKQKGMTQKELFLFEN